MITPIQILKSCNNSSNKSNISSGAKRVAMHALQEAAKCPRSSIAIMRKKYAFHVATLDLFSHWAPHIDWSNKKIVLSAYVLNDGFGDYFNMLTQAESLQKKHPELQIFLLIEFLDFAKRSSHLELPNPKHFSYAFIEGSKVHMCHSKSQELVDTPQFWIREEIEDADWVLQVSFLKKRPQALVGYEPVFGLQENGLFSRRKNISIETLGMGVGKFDLGLNFPLNPECKLTDGRAENKQVHFGYFSGQNLDFQRLMFLITSISLANKDQAIAFNFCYEELSKLLQDESMKMLLGKLDVKEVLLNDKEEIACGLQGRRVEVFNPFPLTRQDFANFVQNAQGLIGCTGDVSFSKPIFFDNKSKQISM